MRSKNAFIYYLTIFLRDITFWQSVALLVAKDYWGLSYQQAYTLASVSLLVNIVFQIPTGAFADKYGRKLAYFIGSCLLLADGIIAVTTKSYPMLLLAFSLQGVGLSLMSGSTQSLALQWLKEIGRKDQYQRMNANSYAASYFGRAIGSVLSGFLFILSPVLGKFLTALTSFISGFVLLTFKVSSDVEHTSPQKNNLDFTKKGIQAFWHTLVTSRKAQIMLVGTTLLTYITNVAWASYQVYFTHFNFKPEWFGYSYAAIAVISTISTLITKKTKFEGKEIDIMKLLYFGNIVIALLLLVPNAWVLLFTLLALSFLFGYHGPLKSTYFDAIFPAEYRTTCLSALAILGTIASIAYQQTAGFLLDNYPLYAISIALGGGSLLTLLWLFLQRKGY